jgi:hypothetical protein
VKLGFRGEIPPLGQLVGSFQRIHAFDERLVCAQYAAPKFFVEQATVQWRWERHETGAEYYRVRLSRGCLQQAAGIDELSFTAAALNTWVVIDAARVRLPDSIVTATNSTTINVFF